MKNYDYQKALHLVWEKAVRLYNEGNRDSSRFFDETESAFLREDMGVTAQEVFDFAEDFVNGGEPDFTTFAMIHDIRRAFFRECQDGKMSDQQLDPSTLPPKDEEREGIVWLPRIIEKAKAKLSGELDPNTMYGCGGDRNFCRKNDIHLAEFLRVVWAYDADVEKITSWVKKRREETFRADAEGEKQLATGEGSGSAVL